MLLLLFAYLSVVESAYYDVNLQTECVKYDEDGRGCSVYKHTGKIERQITCFPEDSFVTIRCHPTSLYSANDNCILRMSELRIGDEVLNPNNEYETVIGWLHRAPNGYAQYVVISTSNPSHQITLSGEHLLFVNDEYIRADDVKLGDTLTNQNNQKAIVTRIQKNVYKNGIYNPWLSKTGTFFVNSFHVHTLTHETYLAPMTCWKMFSYIASVDKDFNEENNEKEYIHPTVKRLQWLFGIPSFSSSLSLGRERRKTS